MVGQRDPKFYSELKQLNGDLIEYLKLCHEKSPFFNLSPPLKDYIKQFDELNKQYPDKSFAGTNPSPPKKTPVQNSMSAFASATPFVPTFGNQISSLSSLTSFSAPTTTTATTSTAPSLNTLTSTTSSSQLTFGCPPTTTSTSIFSSSIVPTSTAASSLTTTKAAEPPTMQPFLFGATSGPSSIPRLSAPTSNTSFFSFTLPPKKEEDNNNKQPDGLGNNQADGNAKSVPDEDTPPEPKIDKYEEPDAKHSTKCKLYEKGKGSGSDVNFNLLGIGILYVKALDTLNKLQVIVRQEPDLRRVLLNDVITSNIPVKLLPKAVQIVLPGQNGETRFYIIKVRDEAEANTLFEMLNLAKT